MTAPRVPTTAHDPRACDGALARAMTFLGKRWNGLLLGVLSDGPAGFSDLRRALRISDSVLSDRLAGLTEAGLVSRTVDPGPPTRVTYALTEAGEGLAPALAALTDWSRDHLPQRD
ncbi:winged helix-turn-helix transcriptional regulator [Nocardioides bruguierae]|nr:helix-turn-helix domain-containing protein [Nocardioides bruguierae]MCL8025571.1 helix-turn-helix transcriptional regulator [Nocardioides bruguierae]